MPISDEARQAFLDEINKKRTLSVAKQSTVPDSDKFAAGVEASAKESMIREQQTGGAENLVRLGLQNVKDREGLAKYASSSTKAGLDFAAVDLMNQANRIMATDPSTGALLKEQSSRLSELANSIQTTVQDAQIGTNLRFGTPFGSGRTSYSGSPVRGNPYFMPAYGNISRDSAMNIPISTSYGTKNLGDRIENIQEYAKENSPFIKAAGGSLNVPGFAQYHNARMEGLSPKDYSANGWIKGVRSAAEQGLGTAIMGTGFPGLLVGSAMAAAGTMDSRSDSPQAYNESQAFKDKALEFGTEFAGGLAGGYLPRAPRAMGMLGKRYKRIKAPSGPFAGANARQNVKAKLQTDIENYDNKIKELTPLSVGDETATNNAFLKYAQDARNFGGDATEAWRYNPGYVADEYGAMVGKPLPWTDYSEKIQANTGRAIEKEQANLARMQADRSGLSGKLADEELKTVSDFPVRQAQQAYDDVVEAERQTNKVAMERAFSREKATETRRARAEQAQEKKTFTRSEQTKLDDLNAEIADYEAQMRKANKQLARDPSDAENGTLYNTAEKKRFETAKKRDLLEAKADDRRIKAVERAKAVEEEAKRAFAEAYKAYQNPKTSKGALTAQRNLELAKNNYETATAQKSRLVGSIRDNIKDLDDRIANAMETIQRLSDEKQGLLSEGAQAAYRKNAKNLAVKNAKSEIERLEGMRNKLAEQLDGMGEAITAPAPQSRSPFLSNAVASAIGLASGASFADNAFYPGFKDAFPSERPAGSTGQEMKNSAVGSYFGISDDADIARFKGFRR